MLTRPLPVLLASLSHTRKSPSFDPDSPPPLRASSQCPALTLAGQSLETLAERGWGSFPCTVPGVGRTRSRDRGRNAFHQSQMAPSGPPRLLLGAGGQVASPRSPSCSCPSQESAQGLPGLWRGGRLHPRGGAGGGRKEEGLCRGGPSCP